MSIRNLLARILKKLGYADGGAVDPAKLNNPFMLSQEQLAHATDMEAIYAIIAQLTLTGRSNDAWKAVALQGDQPIRDMSSEQLRLLKADLLALFNCPMKAGER